MKIETILITMLAVSAVGIASMSKLMAAPANGTGIIGAAQAASPRQDVVLEFKCKINGRWRPGRCPLSEHQVTCVHHRTEKFRHAGHCKTPSF
jgi:hypothetical protein